VFSIIIAVFLILHSRRNSKELCQENQATPSLNFFIDNQQNVA
jgi:hypothetical protein